jgi:uncharacterized membrane protein YedE/YeeE
MPLPLSPDAATQAVLWGGLAIGAVLGAVTQISRFCTMGALADALNYGGLGRLLMWALAVAVAAAGNQVLIAAGWLDAARTLAWSPRLLWLSCLVGGGLFGLGMVLASGCPQRNLVRAGAGSLKAVVTLLAVAVSAQMTLRGLLAVPRTRLLDAQAIALPGPQDLGTLLAALGGPAAGAWRVALCALLALACAALLWRHRAAMEPGQRRAGVVVGLLVVTALALTGHIGHLPEHPETLEPAWQGTASHRPEGLSFAGPLAQSLDLLTLWTDRNTTASFGITVLLGVLAGSAAAALWRRQWRPEGFHSPADLADHLLGGALMGFGGVTALGCSIGQGLTGLSLLSAGAVLAVAGMVAGTALALRLQAWRIERADG